MAEKKDTANRDAQGVRKQNYKRFTEGKDYEKVDAKQTAALCDLLRRGIFGEEETEEGQRVRHAGGRPKKIETVEELSGKIEEYIDYIEVKNQDGADLIPDVEGLALFLGVARSTLFEWQKSRPGEFSDTLKRTLNGFAMYKKQLALTGKIPQLVFATDFNNNHGYIQQHTLEVQQSRPLETLPDRSEIIKRLPIPRENEENDNEELENLLK